MIPYTQGWFSDVTCRCLLPSAFRECCCTSILSERWLYLCTKEICYFKQCNVNVLINFQEQIGVHEIYGCDIHVAEEIPPDLKLKGVLVIKKKWRFMTQRYEAIHHRYLCLKRWQYITKEGDSWEKTSFLAKLSHKKTIPIWAIRGR